MHIGYLSEANTYEPASSFLNQNAHVFVMFLFTGD